MEWLSQTLRHGVICVLPVVVNYSSLDSAWNCLCDELREPLLTANSFKQLLKTRLFAEYGAYSVLEVHYTLCAI